MIDNCYVWCPRCGVRLAENEIKGWGCPKCGTQSVPCSPNEDVWVEVNWHELRILTIWAEQWASHIDKQSDENKGSSQAVAAIAARLQHQWPTLTPLTLSGELGELPDKLRESGLSDGKIESNIPAPERVQVIGPGAVGFGKMPEQKQ